MAFNGDVAKRSGVLTTDLQQKRRGEILAATLMFLEVEKFTSTEVLMVLLSYQSRVGCLKALGKLQKSGFIREYDFDTLVGRKIKLWGIRPAGMCAISEVALEKTPKGFEPRKVSLRLLPHRLRTHEAVVSLVRKGFKLGNAVSLFKPFNKIPDAVLTNPASGQVVALEAELTIKDPFRYEKIIEAYDEPLQKDVVRSVVWLLPNEKMRDRIATIFSKINTEIPKDKHKFFTFEAFEEITPKN